MRIALGSIMQETNTFSPLPTTLEIFQADYLLRGEELLTGFGSARIGIPGMLEVLNAAGVEVVPLLATHACSGGAVTRAAFDWLLADLLARLSAALPGKSVV